MARRTFILIVFLLVATVTGTTFHVILAPPPGCRPVHRFWHNETGQHFYTMDETEKAWLEGKYSHVWVYEGIAWYGWPDPNALPAEEVR